MTADIFEEISRRLVESDLTPGDLRIALGIVEEVKREMVADRTL